MGRQEKSDTIYDLLVTLLDASEDERAWFKRWFAEYEQQGRGEWRFRGLLGYGGKFWIGMDGYRVNCYPEDRTPARERLIREVNAELSVY